MDNELKKAIQAQLAKFFEILLQSTGDTPEIRLLIARYTMGYMGASYGIIVS